MVKVVDRVSVSNIQQSEAVRLYTGSDLSVKMFIAPAATAGKQYRSN
jgi:hypothetical protein